MTQPLPRIKTDRPIDHLQTTAGGKTLFVESAAHVYGIDPVGIDHGLATGALALDRGDGCRKLCDDVSAWAVDAPANVLFCAGETEWRAIALSDGAVAARHRLPAELGGVAGILAVGGERVALWGPPAKSSELDPDPYELFLVGLKNGDVVAGRVLTLPGRMAAHGNPKTREVLVADLQGGQLFRIDAKGKATPVICGFLDEDSALADSFLDGERGLTLHVRKDDGASLLYAGTVSAQEVRWGFGVALPDGNWDHLRWNAQERLWAGERITGRRSALSVVDEHGRVQRERGLPEDWLLTDLAWAGKGRRLYAAVDDSIAVWDW